MPLKSQWSIDIPYCHLATLLFTSPTDPLPDSTPCFYEAARPDTHNLSLSAFRLWSQRFAAGLRKAGLKRGDCVLLFSGNDLFFPIVFMGTIIAGGIFTGANPTYVARELAYQLKDSEAKFLICAEGALDTGLEAAHTIGMGKDRVFVFNHDIYDGRTHGAHGCRYWSDLVASEREGEGFAWDKLDSPEEANRTLALNYSSGTTGVPKGVEITHRNYVANCLQLNFYSTLHPDHEAQRERARLLCFLPMYHAMAQTLFIACAPQRRVPVYIMPKFDFLLMLKYFQKFRITEGIFVPPVMVALVKHPAVKNYDISSMEKIGCGAAPLSRETINAVERLWPEGKINVNQGWGMTE